MAGALWRRGHSFSPSRSSTRCSSPMGGRPTPRSARSPSSSPPTCGALGRAWQPACWSSP